MHGIDQSSLVFEVNGVLARPTNLVEEQENNKIFRSKLKMYRVVFLMNR